MPRQSTATSTNNPYEGRAPEAPKRLSSEARRLLLGFQRTGHHIYKVQRYGTKVTIQATFGSSCCELCTVWRVSQVVYGVIKPGWGRYLGGHSETWKILNKKMHWRETPRPVYMKERGAHKKLRHCAEGTPSGNESTEETLGRACVSVPDPTLNIQQ